MANGLIRFASERAFWPLFFTRLVTEVDLQPFELVLLGAIYEIMIFVSEVPTGVVADVHSRRLSVIISWILGGFAFILSGLATPFGLLLLTQALVGFGQTFQSGAETAWITDELGSADDAEELILRRGQWQFAAGVVGIGLFAGFAVLTSLTAAIVGTGVVMCLWGLVLVAVMPEEGFERGTHEGWREYLGVLTRGWSNAVAVPSLKTLLLVVFIGGVAKEAIDRLDIQRLEEVGLPDDLSPAVIVGVTVVARMALAWAVVGWARRRSGSDGLATSLAVLLVVVSIGIVLLAQGGLLGVAMLGIVIQGGFFNATSPIVESWTNRFADPNARATVHSFMGQAESIGEVGGGLALGAVAQLASVSSAMTISAALFAGSAALALTARRTVG